MIYYNRALVTRAVGRTADTVSVSSLRWHRSLGGRDPRSTVNIVTAILHEPSRDCRVGR